MFRDTPTAGAAPGARCAIIVCDGSTATTRAIGRFVGAGAGADVAHRPRVAERGVDAGFDPRIGRRGCGRTTRRCGRTSVPLPDGFTATRAATQPSRWPSRPLLRPCGLPCRRCRSNACSRVFTVRTPKITGTPVSSVTREIPAAHSPATYSKCGVSPRTTAPMQITASVAPDGRQLLRDERQLERAGNPHDVDLSPAPYFSSVRCAPSSSASVMSRLKRATAIAKRMPVASSSPSSRSTRPRFSWSPAARLSSRSSRWPILRCLARRYAMFSFVGSVCSGTRSTISSP